MRSKLATVMVLLCACGPEVDEVAVQYEPRLCGQEGPVQVLAVDEPARTWKAQEVQGRWLLRRYSVEDHDDGVRSVDVDVDLVDPCGGRRVTLAEDLWPFIVGEQLFGCDLTDGSIYLVDPDSGEVGARVAQHMICEPLARKNAWALMQDSSTSTVAVLHDSGELTPTAVSLTLPTEDGSFIGPYAGNLSTSITMPFTWPEQVKSAGDGRVLVLGDSGRLWMFDGELPEPSEIAAGVDEFVVGENVAVMRDLGDAEVEQFVVRLLDLDTGRERDGPTVGWLSMYGRYQKVEGGLFDVVDGDLHPHPPGISHLEQVFNGPTHLGYRVSDAVQVWDIETGEMLVDEPLPSDEVCSPVSANVVDDGLILSVNTDVSTCSKTELWSYPLDGSQPELLFRVPEGYGAYARSRDVVVYYRRETVTDILHENVRTGESLTILQDVAASVSTSLSLVESSVFDGQRGRLYFVEDGDRTGLWATVLPPE